MQYNMNIKFMDTPTYPTCSVLTLTQLHPKMCTQSPVSLLNFESGLFLNYCTLDFS